MERKKKFRMKIKNVVKNNNFEPYFLFFIASNDIHELDISVIEKINQAISKTIVSLFLPKTSNEITVKLINKKEKATNAFDFLISKYAAKKYSKERQEKTNRIRKIIVRLLVRKKRLIAQSNEYAEKNK